MIKLYTFAAPIWLSEQENREYKQITLELEQEKMKGTYLARKNLLYRCRLAYTNTSRIQQIKLEPAYLMNKQRKFFQQVTTGQQEAEIIKTMQAVQIKIANFSFKFSIFL